MSSPMIMKDTTLDRGAGGANIPDGRGIQVTNTKKETKKETEPTLAEFVGIEISVRKPQAETQRGEYSRPTKWGEKRADHQNESTIFQGRREPTIRTNP